MAVAGGFRLVADCFADRACRARDTGQAGPLVTCGQHLLLHRPARAVPLLQHSGPGPGRYPGIAGRLAAKLVAETHDTAFRRVTAATEAGGRAWTCQREPFQASASERKEPVPLL
jgi:hypothetical protein